MVTIGLEPGHSSSRSRGGLSRRAFEGSSQLGFRRTRIRDEKTQRYCRIIDFSVIDLRLASISTERRKIAKRRYELTGKGLQGSLKSTNLKHPIRLRLMPEATGTD
jgi:hypothetical protein